MRKNVVKGLFFTTAAKMTAEEQIVHKWFIKYLNDKYDSDIATVQVFVRSGSAPAHSEPCAYVCGHVPNLFRAVKTIEYVEYQPDVEVAQSVTRKRINVHK